MSAWREKYKVHPAADVFPMMSDEELAELGADIKNRGVIEPVKFRGDWLLDGRNRLEAAERAGVDIGPPAHLPGVDPVIYVISANLHRRHPSKQARAELIVALAKLDC
jgi:ParB-like chromosome segregation protein Spo0J